MNKNKFILCMFLVLSVSVFCASCKKEEKAAAAKAERQYAVVLDKASVSSVQDYLTVNGEVQSKTNVAIYPEIGGKVSSLSVELGDKVSKNQVISYVDPSKPGSYYSQSPVKAPIAGTVTEIVSRPGTTVTTNTAIVKIGDIKNLVTYAYIPERYVGELNLGLDVDIMLPAYPDEVFKGKIARISPVIDPVSRTKQVEIEFVGYDERINSGMFPKLKIYTSIYDDKIVVPSETVVTRGDTDFVYTVVKNEEGKDIARRIPVKKLVTVDDRVVIASGISAGDTIIVEGMEILIDGAPVNIMTK